VAAHGAQKIPVWGKVFSIEAGRGRSGGLKYAADATSALPCEHTTGLGTQVVGQVDRQVGLIFERQWLHAVGLIILLGGRYFAAQLQAVQLGAVWGLKSIDWYWLAISTAILH
jgi:hypothetical protein